MGITVDIAIIGGSLGGVSAALAAARNGKSVILVEDSRWIGGQVSSQGVPPDEHQYIEEFGCTRSYRTYRIRIRKYYKENYPLNEMSKAKKYLNPGEGWVGPICHEPKVSERVLTDMLSPYVSAGRLKILFETELVSAEVDGRNVQKVVVQRKNGEAFEIKAKYFIDATETGELLPLTDTAYVTGTESKEDTGELHAPEKHNPLDMQAVTWCFAVSLEREGNYTIEKPDRYDYFKEHRSPFWPGSQMSWTYVTPHTLEPVDGSMTKEPGKVDLFSYRKILSENHFEKGFLGGDITLVNWPQNDYWMGPLYEVSKEEAFHQQYMAKELSKSFLYWLQTEADGHGYPNLRPRPDVMGTEDGFAMKPYIRESRRIVSTFRVLEEHIGEEMRNGEKAVKFEDSIGIGHYHLDLHPSTGGSTYIDLGSLPFQIPMGAMISVNRDNLIPGCKNIGTTHITNGCYRLHPVEWNIGESAALMAIYAMDKNLGFEEIRQNPKNLKEFQAFLTTEGIELEWPEGIQ